MSRKEKIIQRLLEILPGFFSWNMILFPYWGVFVMPVAVAYFVLAFNIYWFYQSLTIALTSVVSHLRIQASMQNDWVTDLKKLKGSEKIKNIIIIPTYKEPLYILERTINSLAKQTLNKKQLYVCLAMEKKEPEEDRLIKVKALNKKFGKVFGRFIITVHELTPGEVVGKASNEKYAAVSLYDELIKKGEMNIEEFTVTSCDADHTYHPNHFAALTFLFIQNKKRFNYFWQPAVLFYNNIWDLPAITRIPNTFGSIWNLSQLPRKDRLINAQNYSLSFKLLHEVGYWDADKIPEDWGIFFKAYYKKQGDLEVEPLYLPLFADAALANGFWATLKNQYEQYKRWAWGVSDDPWIIKSYITSKKVPFVDKTMRLLFVIQAHFMWPVNWFIITVGLTLPTLLNPAFGRTVLGYTVPKMSSFILTIALSFLLIMFVLDYIYKPKRPKDFPLWRAVLMPLEFVLMPVAGFFFNALPGLDAHTRLMLGKYMEYRVTEKV